VVKEVIVVFRAKKFYNRMFPRRGNITASTLMEGSKALYFSFQNSNRHIK